MKNYDFYAKSPKNFAKYWLLCLLVIFFLTVTIFALLEVRNFYSDKSTVMRIFINSFKSSKEEEVSKSSPTNFMLVNVDQSRQHMDNILKHITAPEESNTQRQAREVKIEKNSTKKTNFYYEEQTPVVVYSKTDQDPLEIYRQKTDMLQKQDSNEEGESYNEDLSSEDYGGNEEPDYYGQEEHELQNQPQQYIPRHYEPSSGSQYYDDSREDFSAFDNDRLGLEEGRSAKYPDYNSYYNNWHYATPPLVAAGPGTYKKLGPDNAQENHKMPPISSAPIHQQNREPYPLYVDDYDYIPNQSPSSHLSTYLADNQQMQQNRKTSSSSQAVQKSETGQKMSFLTILKTLKTMWDLYQSFTSSWNTLVERRNREEELAKQKYQQQKRVRINSRKPPTFSNKRNQVTTTKRPRKPTSTTIAPVSNISEINSSSEEEEEQQPVAKVEPRKAVKEDKSESNKEVEDLRDKRQATGKKQESTDVGEGRYIKGDPLKGYYDFVITEGSYKFWAVFQVGTALLIIYSTFAAIYYSKVNPLVSDYDYTDYLGGARSLTDGGGDLDFVDDDDASAAQKTRANSWLEWLPRTGHSLKFILEAIDKLPTDHSATDTTENSENIKSTDDISQNNTAI